MDQSVSRKPIKTYVWIILAIIIIFACCCLATGVGAFAYLRSQDQSVEEWISGESGSSPETGEAEEAGNPDMAEIDREEEELVQTDDTLDEPDDVIAEESAYPIVDRLVVKTSSGLWLVNEKTGETTQISEMQVEEPWNFAEGLSPDQRTFAFMTGFSENEADPQLIVLDLESQTTILQLPLTGPVIQPGAEGSHGDPAFEAYHAMDMSGSMAWSPDGSKLAFVAAMDGSSADVYLFDRSDSSINRLSEEEGHASELHWSPNGQYLQYVSVFTFGTGAGAGMEGLWAYDFDNSQVSLLEYLDSDGENFVSWIDDDRFLISSFGRLCGGYYNLRVINASNSEQYMITPEGFTAVAYDPEEHFGMFSMAYDYDNCGNTEPLDMAMMIFGKDVGVPLFDDIGRKWFEEIIAYGIGFTPEANLFRLYGDSGLEYIYYDQVYRLKILPELVGYEPYPAPIGEYWTWSASMYSSKSGLWITGNNNDPISISPMFNGEPLWHLNGQTLYYFDYDQLFSASAPYFEPELIISFSGQEILGMVK